MKLKRTKALVKRQVFHELGSLLPGMIRIISLFTIFVLLTECAFTQNYTGYTLYFPQGGTKAYLTDVSGANYHTWTFNSNASTTYATYLLAGGVLLRTVNHQGNYFTGGPISGEVQKVDWSGNVLWDFVYSTQDYCTHHDIQGMPDGNVLLISYERKTAAQVVQAGCTQSLEMWPDKIVEIQPVGTNGGNVVWEWHAWDHLVQDHDPSKDNYGVVADHPELLNINYHTAKDWIHMNGIDYNAELDQIVFSSHALNELYVIDHSTTIAEAASHSGGNSGKGGDFLYRWGNPAAYQAQGTADFNVVHDAHWISADDPAHPNELCGYNNKGGAGNKTCVDIFNPPYNGYNYLYTPGSAYAPSTYDWRYTYSGNQQQDNGSSQQLPNGNTLVCIGMNGLILELNPSQAQVWSKSVGTTIAQAFRYPPCFVNGTFIADAGADASICSGTSAQLNVTATGGDVYKYIWTSAPPGFTSNIQNPLVTPSLTTLYKVTIKNGPCSASDSVLIVVNDLPEAPVISVSNDTLYSSSSINNQWYRNGEVIANANQRFYVPAQSGNYQVGVVDLNGCQSPLSLPYIVTSLQTIPAIGELAIYPSPTNGAICIKGLSDIDGKVLLDIYDIAGKCILSKPAASSSDISELTDGIYILKLKLNDQTLFNQRIILIK
ncbi:MAG: aryl-sulfate sulfotransferase [Bacteroidetes bacterium]|nr:aryl-sulfate sulfotransferase [Bacteroidota bacterium]